MGFFGKLISLLNDGVNDLQRDIYRHQHSPPQEQHPATIQELDKLAGTIIFFESLKGMHNRMVANRQHEEMMDELRRIGRE